MYETLISRLAANSIKALHDLRRTLGQWHVLPPVAARSLVPVRVPVHPPLRRLRKRR
jgi:hypothetical protein